MRTRSRRFGVDAFSRPGSTTESPAMRGRLRRRRRSPTTTRTRILTTSTPMATARPAKTFPVPVVAVEAAVEAEAATGRGATTSRASRQPSDRRRYGRGPLERRPAGRAPHWNRHARGLRRRGMWRPAGVQLDEADARPRRPGHADPRPKPEQPGRLRSVAALHRGRLEGRGQGPGRKRLGQGGQVRRSFQPHPAVSPRTEKRQRTEPWRVGVCGGDFHRPV